MLTWKLPCLPCIGQCLDGLDCTLTTTLLLRSLNSLEAAEAWRIANRLKFCSNSSASITINSSVLAKAKSKLWQKVKKTCQNTVGEHFTSKRKKNNKVWGSQKLSAQLFELASAEYQLSCSSLGYAVHRSWLLVEPPFLLLTALENALKVTAVCTVGTTD